MSPFSRVSLLPLAPISLLLAACAAPAPVTPVNWSRPYQPSASTPVLLHDLTIANPPYPSPFYPNYFDEPTRFEFRPRNPVILDENTTADETEEPAAPEFPYLENGILYVDPNQ